MGVVSLSGFILLPCCSYSSRTVYSTSTTNCTFLLRVNKSRKKLCSSAQFYMNKIEFEGIILLVFCSKFTFIYLLINTDFAFVLVALYFTFSLLWFNWQNKMIVFSLRYNVKYFIINQPTRRVVWSHLYAIFNPLGVFFFFLPQKQSSSPPICLWSNCFMCAACATQASSLVSSTLLTLSPWRQTASSTRLQQIPTSPHPLLPNTEVGHVL